MPTKKLTEEGVQRLKPVEGKQIDYYDQVLRGLILRVNWSGRKSWRIRYSDNGKTRTHALGYYPDIGVKQAREAATAFKANLKEFLAQRATPALSRSTFDDIADDWIKRVVDANGLRSARQLKSYLTKVIKPAWQGRPIADIRRGDVTALLDKVADERGSRAADYVLAVVRQITQWHQTRVEDYVSPIVKGMARTKPKEKRRKRILTDDEIRSMWKACGKLGTFGALTKILLLTAQRRTKVATMQRAHIADGTWTIATEAREKNNAQKLKLPAVALAIIEEQPKIDGNEAYVFPASRRGRRTGPGRDFGSYSAFGEGKAALDKLMLADLKEQKLIPHDATALPQWQLHDLRRTARSLMARADIRPDVAERVLGHTQSALVETYDRHDYAEQRAQALEKLATLITLIIDPPNGGNVVSMKRR